MKTTFLSALITIALIETVVFLQTSTRGDAGSVSFVYAIVIFFLGMALCFPDQTRNIGKGVLIASGIVLLIGLSLCSNS